MKLDFSLKIYQVSRHTLKMQFLSKHHTNFHDYKKRFGGALVVLNILIHSAVQRKKFIGAIWKFAQAGRKNFCAICSEKPDTY